MRTRLSLPGWRALALLAAATLTAAAVSFGSAYGSSRNSINAPMKESAIGFDCSGGHGSLGFGTVNFVQTGSTLTVKFRLVHAPPLETLDVNIGQCPDQFSSPDERQVGTVTTDDKGQAKGSFSATLFPGNTLYFLCIEGGRHFNEWGTDPEPIV